MDNSFIRICQFNIERVINKKPLLINFLFDHNIDICLLNETWLRENNIPRIPNYVFITQCDKDGRCGVGILVKDNLKYTIHPIF